MMSRGGYLDVSNFSQLMKFLRIRRVDVSEEHAVSFYLGGFPTEIEMRVRMSKPNTSASAPIRKHMTQKEYQEKRAQNLCFYCDQKYTPGHKCSGKLFSIVLLADEELKSEEEYMKKESLMPEDLPQVSLNALNGANSFQTIRITGKISKHEVHILVDCGATHNFLDVNVAKQVGCKTNRTYPLEVNVGVGIKLISNAVCKNFEWQLQGETFYTDMMILPLGGYELVLGIKWLATLGDIKCNFSQLRMEFMYKDKKITLRGTPKAAIQWLEEKNQDKEFEGTTNDELLMFCVYPKSMMSLKCPIELPPKRSHDHRIPPLLNTQPINIRPYRHPPIQKDAIEVMVKELLDSGVIKPSTSPFASPIVMVKKKDNTWRVCVDYRQLNKHTVKDKFHILIIEELIEELHGAIIFSKLDLRSRYHQIRMQKEDIPKTDFKTHQGHYEFMVMPFGLTNAPSTFQALMNEILQPFLRKFTLTFKSVDKEGRYRWTEKAQLAFETLETATQRAPILALPGFTKPFKVETDASGVGIGAILQQNRHPIAYMRKTLSLKHQNLSTNEKEFLAVLLELKKWRGYLLDRHFIIRTDHFSLKYSLDKKITTHTQMKWLRKLIRFDYEVVYKKGSKNKTADALSKVQTSELFSMITTLVSTDIAKKIKDTTQSTPFEIVYGVPPPIHVPYFGGLSKVEAVDRTLKAREEAIQTVKYHLIKSQNRMKQQTDQGRSKRSFEIGDWVLLKLKSQKQVTVRMGKQHKFSPKYYGPFRVMAKVGQVAYQLELNSQVQIHIVFHVSQLKQHRGKVPNGQHIEVPVCDQSGLLATQPLALLDRKMVKKRNAV
uniref:RNA-directed DNA polymerase n=1 Tax=Tanacetum cinerariifolium TaxID=118510 RepID=A0A6L2JHG7_TANCI|nr:hypothetical protein [Tanacetum cinerariifolium]